MRDAGPPADDNAAVSEPSPPARSRLRARDLLVVIACACVIVASLRAAATFFVPVAMALMVSMVCIPAVRWLERMRVPSPLAIVLVLVVVVVVGLIVPLVVGAAVTSFQAALPEYREKMGPWFHSVTDALRARGWDVPERPVLSEWYDTGSLFQLVADATRGAVRVLSNVVVVLLVIIFTLVEARLLPRKLEWAFGAPEAARTFEQIVERVGRYVSVKTLMSLLTGVLVGSLNAAVGVDFPVLWGFVAFAFNFIPNIGSILAAIPPVLLAALEFGFGPAALVGFAYGVINLSISNGLEPQLMGARLGLSTLVVFLSLLFWFWVWGPIGMLLSAPLTMILKITLEQSDELRPVALLLGRYREPDRSP